MLRALHVSNLTVDAVVFDDILKYLYTQSGRLGRRNPAALMVDWVGDELMLHGVPEGFNFENEGGTCRRREREAGS
jgi:hypothetical protein